MKKKTYIAPATSVIAMGKSYVLSGTQAVVGTEFDTSDYQEDYGSYLGDSDETIKYADPQYDVLSKGIGDVSQYWPVDL